MVVQGGGRSKVVVWGPYVILPVHAHAPRHTPVHAHAKAHAHPGALRAYTYTSRTWIGSDIFLSAYFVVVYVLLLTHI